MKTARLRAVFCCPHGEKIVFLYIAGRIGYNITVNKWECECEPMLQFDEYKIKLNNLLPDLEELGQALGLAAAERELDMLQAESAADGFWDNLEKAQKVQQRIKQLLDKVEGQKKRTGAWEDLMTLCEMGNEEEDASLIPELEEGYAALELEMEEARLSTLFTGEYDNSNAILNIHPGAGGTEAQDWAVSYTHLTLPTNSLV